MPFYSFFQDIELNGTGNTVTGLRVTFSEVNLFTTGLYGCEASADPSFHTELVRKYLTVLGKRVFMEKGIERVQICLEIVRAEAKRDKKVGRDTPISF